MILFLAYSVYSIQASLPDSLAVTPDLGKSLEVLVDDLLDSGLSTARALARDGIRDPFQVRAQPDSQAGASQTHDVTAAPESDPLAEIVQGLKLDATFLQGRDQIAIIDGRIYSRGQHLLVDGDDGKSSSPLFVVSVLPSKVILRGNGKSYELAYPDRLGTRPDGTRGSAAGLSEEAAMAELDPSGQLALFQKLFNSPLGALGKNLTGISSQNDPSRRTGAGSRNRRSRGARAGTAITSSGTP
jgi:hypothetical protein